MLPSASEITRFLKIFGLGYMLRGLGNLVLVSGLVTLMMIFWLLRREARRWKLSW